MAEIISDRDFESLFEENTLRSAKFLNYENIHFELKFQNKNITQQLEFANCTFSQKVFINQTKVSAQLIFKQCHFQKGAFFYNINSKDEAIGTITFEGCSFVGEIVFHEMYLKSLSIHNNTSINKMLFAKTCFDSLELVHVKTQNFEFLEENNIKNVFIKHCEFKQGALLETSVIDSFKIVKSTFSRLSIQTEFIVNNYEFNEVKFEDTVSIEAPKFLDSRTGFIRMEYCEIKKDFNYFYFSNQENTIGHKQILINNNIIHNTFEIIDLRSGHRNEQRPKALIDHLSIVASNKGEGEYKISNINVKDIRMLGINGKSAIRFEEINCQSLAFIHFLNFGSLFFINCFKENLPNKSLMQHLRIEGSELENLTILNSNLKAFETIRVYDSNITNIKVINSELFEYEQLKGKYEIPKYNVIKKTIRSIRFLFSNYKQEHFEVEDLLNKREVFKQVKISMEQQGDRINSLTFKSYEMKAYREFITLTQRVWNKDRIILALSSINDFGLNWLKATAWCIVTMLLLYIVIMIQVHPELEFRFNPKSFGFTFEILRKNFNIYFQLLNPVHEVSKVFPFKPNNVTYFLDYFSRITISFFIFQIVSAFRKYIK